MVDKVYKPQKLILIFLAKTHGAVDKAFGWTMLLNEIILRLQVRLTRNTYYNNTCTCSWLREFEQSMPMVQIKGSVRDYWWTSEFDMKILKVAEEYIGRNIVIITIRMASF